MSSYYSILPPGHTDSIIADKDTFIRAAQKQWPGCRIFHAGHGEHDSDVDIFPIFDGTEMQVFHFPDGKVVSARGALPDRGIAEVAAWVRTLNPDPDFVLWLTDMFFTGHVVLTPGITPEQIRASWVDHAEHDPAVEYPEYFGN
ncbi:hypothetical protein [Actinomyces qiguomingii]|uniref:hypothetical protein n=1 Tax=Actinomyces qiguomingii TaxID=2057800 RepID=UPI001E4881C5|nr:hypothetical protein [Actinomyces qiguomingii]